MGPAVASILVFRVESVSFVLLVKEKKFFLIKLRTGAKVR